MNNSEIVAIVASLKHDESRLKAIEQLPPDVQAKYAPGIAKLRHRILQERAALGILPEDTESWAKWLLEDVDGEQPEDTRRRINSSLAKVEAARVAADIAGMQDEQRRLEQFIREISQPEQMSFVI